MSFTKVNRSLHGPGKRIARSRRIPRQKQDWVSTIHDLTVHKATPEELSQRHEIHRSKNQAAAQSELRERALKRRFRRSQPASPSLGHTHRRIIRELSLDQYQLQDVLARSDRAMAVVKDLFGDAPRRQTGFPSVTVAPGCETSSDLPLLQRAEPPTQLSILSQSVMDPQALNELESHSEGESTNHEFSPPTAFTSQSATSRGSLLDQQEDAGFQTHSRLLTPDPQKASHSSFPQSPTALPHGQQAALNATQTVQRVQPRTVECEQDPSSALVSRVLNPNPAATKPDKKIKSSGLSRRQRADISGLNSSAVSSLSGNLSSLEILQSMLGEVEVELDSLDPAHASEAAGTCQAGSTLTRFSMSLVSNLGRLVHHLRLSREEVRREVEERKRLEEEVREHRQLIDALTGESLSLREENTTLQQHMKDLEVRLDALVLALGEPERLGAGDLMVSDGTVPSCVRSEAAPPCPETDLQDGMRFCPAIMLSPPRQTDSRTHHNEGTNGQLLQYHITTTREQHPLADEISECDDSKVSSSSPSFASLPRHTPRESATLQPVHDSALHHTLRQSQQNISVQAKLGQLNLMPKEELAQQDTTDTSVPLSDAERRLMPNRAAQRTAQQTALPVGSSVTSVQQRLLELNKQSAAARQRLLELIEQQRQESGGGISPSISPIPSHDGERTLDVPISLPDSSLGVESSTTRSSRDRNISPLTQAHKEKGQGWFALSAHVK